MRWLLTIAVLLASCTPCLAEDRLPSRPIEVPLAAVPDPGPWSFDLIEFRAAQRRLRPTPTADLAPPRPFVRTPPPGLAGDPRAAGLLVRLSPSSCDIHPSLAGQSLLAAAVEVAYKSSLKH